MKTVLLFTTIALYTFCGFGQEQIASIEVSANEATVAKTSMAKNLAIFNSLDQSILPKKIMKLHRDIASFNIEDLKNYNAKDPSNYEVSFHEKNMKVRTVYNKDGVLSNYNGTYKNISLPYKLSSIIAESYPGWQFKKTVGACSYSQGKFIMNYKIVIKKDGKSKTLKYDATDYGI